MSGRNIYAAAFATVALCLCGGSARGAPAAKPPCYIAFLHGSGPDFLGEGPGADSRIERYFSPDGAPGSSFVFHAGRQGDGPRGCAIWRVGYDGGAAYWHARAAGQAAASLHDFIDRQGIPDGALVLIGHSLGGLVARYVVNSGVPESPFYNEYKARNPRMDYDLIRRKTAFIVTVQTPHLGAQAADAVYGAADGPLANRVVAGLRSFGLDRRSGANASMMRASLIAASRPGGDMADEGRTVPIYTIAGTSPRGGSHERDAGLDVAWTLLCYMRGAANGWGAACPHFMATRGDGMVESESAHGQGAGFAVGGAHARWFDVELNHNQGRFNLDAALITDHLSGGTSHARLGSYIGAHVLPWPHGEREVHLGGPGVEIETSAGRQGRLPQVAYNSGPALSSPAADAFARFEPGAHLVHHADGVAAVVSLLVDRPGPYFVYAELWSGTRPIAFSRRLLPQTPRGPLNVSLRFAAALVAEARGHGAVSVRGLRAMRVDAHPAAAIADPAVLVLISENTVSEHTSLRGN